MFRSGRTTEQGFSLLEVMVSLAILSISLVAILNLHSGAVRMHNHAKFLSLATLLARSKMVDIEERIFAEDLSDLRALDERSGEPARPFEDFLKELEGDGLL